MPLYRLRQTKTQRYASVSRKGDLSVDLVAVHGLEADSSEAWTDPGTNILWLRDLLPSSLDVARTLTFGYNAIATSFYGDRSADRIQQHAQTLVADLQADRSLEGCMKRPIIFLCHGLGGILVKKALAYSSTRTTKHVQHLYSIFTSTYAVLFFGTPHLGTEKTSWLIYANSMRDEARSEHESRLLAAIGRDSETLQAINDQFIQLMNQFRIFFFWEERETDLGEWKGFVVEESSAAPLIGNIERAGIYGSHLQMVRFADDQASSYRTVIEAIVRYARDAPLLISRRWKQAEVLLAWSRSNEAAELAGTAFDIHHDNQPFSFERKISERAINKHFLIPQVVSSIFTGREDASQAVSEAFWGPIDGEASWHQKRYIIHGIGGSGKTQFCSKFAQDHREKFWGVFWIDATSAETAKHSFAKIGKLGGMEATQSAGKHWLSNLDKPWLLIINNVDDPSFNLSSLFPQGERGHILVTTRNPNFRVHGTVGSIEFKGLKPKDALSLLLRAADSPRPWTSTVKEKGTKIIDELGCLALALVHAGALILQGMCGLGDYLNFYSQHRKRIAARRSAAVPGDDGITIYATWEHSLGSLEIRRTEASSDAAQILSIVAFFHFEHIRVDIFIRAWSNRMEASRDRAKPSLPSRLFNSLLTRIQPPALLPDFLKTDYSKVDDYRIRRALQELCCFSLISYDGGSDTFSLHPVVHAWARDRLGSGEQALWVQIALNVLAESIRLPPKDTGEVHEDYRRDILPHLDLCLQAYPLEILDYEALFGGLRLPIKFVYQHTWLFIFQNQAMSAAKFGYVFAELGRFKDAAVLLFNLKVALVQSRGYQNDKTMKAMLGLARVYWGLGRLEEATALQKLVVDARTCVLGPNHEDTISVMDQLGRSYWLNGQYNEALELQTLTAERAMEQLGSTHEVTLMALDNLGVTFGSWRRFEESRDLHQRVLATREKMLGSKNLDTLLALNNLAMALLDIGELDRAKKYMTEVYEQRRTKLGKEHPWTLWALCNLAKVYTALRLFDQAEDMLVGGIAAAERSLGEDHLGVLMGVGELARAYALPQPSDLPHRLSQATMN